MRYCANIPDWCVLLTALVVPLLAGCSPAQTDFGFTLEQVKAQRSANNLNVVVYQDIILSGEAKDALNHGIPLFIQTEVSLRTRGSNDEIAHGSLENEIRFLPLSKRYELVTRHPFSVRSFPRLRHVLAEIAELKMTLPIEPYPGEQFDLRARTYLEKRNLPPPMRLPTWLSAQWRHDSGWRSWPVTLGDNA